MTLREVLALLLLAALWGASFIFFRIVAPVIHPFVTVEVRVLLAALSLLAYALLTRHPLEFFKTPRRFLLLAIINAVIPFSLFAWSTAHLSASFAAILNATTPVFAAIVAAVWLKERFSLRRILGFPLGIVGVVVLVGWSPFELSGLKILAIVATLLASLAYAVAGSYIKRNFEGVSGLNMAMGQQFAASAILLGPALVTLPASPPSLTVTLALLALAILSTALAYILYFYLMRRVGPTKTLSVTFLIPVFASFFGVLWLGEQLSLGMVFGLGLILLSVILVNDLGKS